MYFFQHNYCKSRYLYTISNKIISINTTFYNCLRYFQLNVTFCLLSFDLDNLRTLTKINNREFILFNNLKKILYYSLFFWTWLFNKFKFYLLTVDSNATIQFPHKQQRLMSVLCLTGEFQLRNHIILQLLLKLHLLHFQI